MCVECDGVEGNGHLTHVAPSSLLCCVELPVCMSLCVCVPEGIEGGKVCE